MNQTPIMNIQILKEIGLTDSQIAVYLSLLNLGSTKSGSIIKSTRLAGSVVYRALDELIQQGLVNFVIKSKTKFFSATEPKNIMRLWEDKKNKLSSLIPELEALDSNSSLQETKMYVGWKGVQTAFNSIFTILPKNGEYLAFALGANKNEPDSVKIFFKNFHLKRIEMKYKVKLIVNKSDKNVFDTRFKNVKNWQIKYVNDFAPRGIGVYGDTVRIASFDDTPIAVMITSKQIASTFRFMFNAIWNTKKN